MKNHTDSCIVEYNEDGTKTVTTIETYTPPTKAQQTLAVAGLLGLCFAPLAPLALISLNDYLQEKRASRKEAKKLKAVPTT